MNLVELAKRKAEAIQMIADKLNIDLSTGSMPKAPNPQVLELFRLEKIADSVVPVSEETNLIDIDEALRRIEATKGVGVGLVAKIEVALRE